MNNMVIHFLSFLLVGVGATLILDLWTLLLRRTLKITPSNYCLLGRWLRYMTEGTLKHPNLASSPPKSRECMVGWIAHYAIGITFAITFISVVGTNWLQNPTLFPAILFGNITVLAPFVIMQPLFGLGIAASETANPLQARVRSLMNHTIFGISIYLSGLLAGWLLSLKQ